MYKNEKEHTNFSDTQLLPYFTFLIGIQIIFDKTPIFIYYK